MFKFKIGSILSGDELASLSVQDSVTLEHLYHGKKHYKFLKPITLMGNFTNTGKGIIKFEGNIKTTLQLRCSRCTEYVEYPVTIDFNQRFSANQEEATEDDIELIKGNTVNLEHLVMDEIKLSIPMKVVCNDDCKGLCSVCGINLNEDSCSCQATDVDPRLSILKDLFKQ